MSVILASAGYDHTIRFWEALTGVCCRTIPHDDSQVNLLAITQDKKLLVAAGGGGHVRVYDVTTGVLALEFTKHTGNVTGVSMPQDHRWVASCGEDSTIRVWDLRTGNVERQMSIEGSTPVNEVAVHPNQGEIVSCDGSGNLTVWDLGDNRAVSNINLVDESFQSVSLSSDGQFAIGGTQHGVITQWDMQSNEFQNKWNGTGDGKPLTRVVVSSDGRHIASCSADRTARVWSTASGVLETTLAAPHQRWVWDCAFSADSAYLVTACSDHYVRLWDLATNETVRQYNGHSKGVISVALNDI